MSYKVIFDGNSSYTGEVRFATTDKDKTHISLFVKEGVVKNESDAEFVYKNLHSEKNYAKFLFKTEDKKESKTLKEKDLPVLPGESEGTEIPKEVIVSSKSKSKK